MPFPLIPGDDQEYIRCRSADDRQLSMTEFRKIALEHGGVTLNAAPLAGDPARPAVIPPSRLPESHGPGARSPRD